jgi:hypothetical protein
MFIHPTTSSSSPRNGGLTTKPRRVWRNVARRRDETVVSRQGRRGALVSTLDTGATEDEAWGRAARLLRHSRCFVKVS